MTLRIRSRSRCRWHRQVGGGGTLAFTEYPTGQITWNGKKYYKPFWDLLWDSQFAKLYSPTLYSNTDLHRYDYSTMTDVEPSKNTRLQWNFCEHVKRDLVSGRHWFTSQRNTGTQWSLEANRFSTPAAVYESDLPSSPGATQWHNWRAQSYALLVPKLANTDFSLFNYLIELGELKGAIKLCTRGVSAIATHVSNMVKSLGSASDLGKTPAELALTYDFGIKPFINDTAKLTELLTSVRKDIIAFNKRGEGRSVHHVELPLVVSNTSAVSGMSRVFTVKLHTFRAQAELTYKIDQGLIDRLSDLDLITERLGLRATPGRIWNAVPLSFLVDWVFSVGDFLESLDTSDVFRATPKVSRYSESLTSEVWKIACFKVGQPGTNSYYFREIKSEVHEDGLLPERMYQYLDGWIPMDYTVVRKYVRQPVSWEGTFSNPFATVRLPELSVRFNVQRLRDGLALARLRL